MCIYIYIYIFIYIHIYIYIYICIYIYMYIYILLERILEDIQCKVQIVHYHSLTWSQERTMAHLIEKDRKKYNRIKK